MKTFLALLALAPGLYATPVQASAPPTIEAKVQGHSYRLEQKEHKFIFHGHRYTKSIAVASCNADLIEEFFNRFERYSRDYVRHPASVNDSPAITLTTNGKPSKVAATSRLGRWLRDLTGEVHRLSARSAYHCEKE